MYRLTIETDTALHAKLLSSFLKTVSLVKSVTIMPDSHQAKMLNEPAGEYNWINPSRPATNKEIEQLCIEMEQETGGENSDVILKRSIKKIKSCLKK